MRLRIIALAALLGLLPAQGYGEEPDSSAEGDTETVVTPARGAEAAFASPRAIDTLSTQRLRERPPATVPEAIEDEPGIFVQRTYGAGGAPILRGLMGQHVLILVDGIRLNNSITPSGPNELLGTIDPFQVQRVEIMHGPASVLYGSDAMGGVINIITRRPAYDPRRAWGTSAEFTGRFDSADLGLLGHLDLAGHIRGLGLRVGGSLKRFDDLEGGRDTGTQRFTGYWEGDADVAAQWVLSPSSSLSLSYAAVRQNDASRTNASTPIDFLRVTDHNRDSTALTYSGSFTRFFIRQVNAALSFQRQFELRERFRLALDRIEREQDQVDTLGGLLALRTDLPYNALTYGVDVYHDWLDSSASQEAIGSPTLTQLDRGRYADGATSTQVGVYVMDHVPLTRKLALDFGGRVSTWTIQIPATPQLQAAAVQITRPGVIGTFHGRYLLGNGINLIAGVGQGYRAPNLDDFSALGCGAQSYDVPNTELKPEKSLTAEAGLKLDLFGALTGSLFYYFTYLDDLVVRMPSTLATSGGQTSRVSCGLTPRGTPIWANVYERDNARSGQLHGIEASLHLALGPHWSLFGWTAWARGNATFEGPPATTEPLSLVPPLNGLAGVRYDVADERGFAELAVRWAARQNRLSAADHVNVSICPQGQEHCDGTPGFAILALRGGARLTDELHLTAAVENLTNETYRFHGSAVAGAGLSALLGLELRVP